MITQTYDDWSRMLHACARAATGGSSFTPERVLAVLSGDDLTRDDETMRVKAVAAALGIDRRRRLEWRPTSAPNVYEPTNGYGICHERGEEGWDATIMWGMLGTLKVTGHPTRESAIEHLERLLGRLA